MKRRAIASISGLVQGIGFRPFIYRLATKWNLKGYVKNLGDAGVRADVNGEAADIKAFLREVEAEKIPIAVYTRIDVEWLDYSGEYADFIIDMSDLGKKEVKHSLIPPDTATCPDCLRELFDPNDRHYLYPFTCCALCGPRFTTITDLPYDRERTTMIDFPMCEDCGREFYTPVDRRFNAQTICCGQGGPTMTLYDPSGGVISDDDPIMQAARLLEEGYIIAVKGIGGIHLSVKATEDDAILELRRRRRKPGKPFALMSPNMEAVEGFALISPRERELLTSLARPVVALRKLDPFSLSPFISPGLHNVGVMLPYSGIHHLLFYYSDEPAFVMTSANFPGEPMFVSNEAAFEKLKGVADYLLLHNRVIYARCDDSVIRMTDDKPIFLRKSRGYVPNPIGLPFKSDKVVIAVGPELASTAALLKEDKCYPTQHLGDIESPESLTFLREAINHQMKLLGVKRSDVIACDLHPRFLSRGVAEELVDLFDASLVEVQHHHSHMASLMAESGIGADEEIVTVDCDGYGYGSDGTPWGGEILIGGYRGFKRVGHLEPQPMPGGDLSAYRYGRMLQGILYSEMPMRELRALLVGKYLDGFAAGESEVDIVFDQISKGINTPKTTSAGRLLDAVSCLLGISYSRTYEGEGAMKLESAAYYGADEAIELPIEISEDRGKLTLKTSKMVAGTLDLMGRHGRGELARAFQRSLAYGLSEMALTAAERSGIGTIGFTGGVAYNDMLTRVIRERVEARGLRFLRHTQVPSGDGGVSLGQAVVASFRAS
ncbi:MAG TPA: carbamoyltransferase HypF [Patescibacteria group bacterium]|nr:carbamoyltransferase HypF [Patescibacteria group bacterium]